MYILKRKSYSACHLCLLCYIAVWGQDWPDWGECMQCLRTFCWPVCHACFKGSSTTGIASAQGMYSTSCLLLLVKKLRRAGKYNPSTSIMQVDGYLFNFSCKSQKQISPGCTCKGAGLHNKTNSYCQLVCGISGCLVIMGWSSGLHAEEE